MQPVQVLHLLSAALVAAHSITVSSTGHTSLIRRQTHLGSGTHDADDSDWILEEPEQLMSEDDGHDHGHGTEKLENSKWVALAEERQPPASDVNDAHCDGVSSCFSMYQNSFMCGAVVATLLIGSAWALGGRRSSAPVEAEKSSSSEDITIAETCPSGKLNLSFCGNGKLQLEYRTVDDAVGETEMITNPVVLAGFRMLVQRPGVSTIFLAVSVLTSCFLSRHYISLKNEPLKLEPFASRLKDAQLKMQHDFPSDLRDVTRVSLLIWSDRRTDITTDNALADLTTEMDKRLNGLKNDTDVCSTLKWQSYSKTMPPAISADFIASDNTASLTQLSLKMRYVAGQRVGCFSSLRDTLTDLDGKFGGLHVSMASAIGVIDASLAKEENDTPMHSLISSPFMIALLLFGVGSLPRAVTPFICLVASIAGMRATIVLIKWAWSDLNYTQPDTAPTFLMLALSYDYALFYWTRFSAERRKHPQQSMNQRAIMTTLMTSGYVIMLSMLVLVVCFVVQCFYPSHNITGGLGGDLQVISGVVFVGFYSLAIPAVLTVQFPSLFDESTSSFSEYVREYIAVRPWWIKQVSGAITRHPWMFVVPCVIFACFIPLMVTLSTAQLSYDDYEGFASHAVPEYAAHQVYADKFDIGRLEPALVLLEASPVHDGAKAVNGTTGAEAWGQASCRFVQSMIDETKGEAYQIDATDVDGPWWDAATGKCRSVMVQEPLWLPFMSSDGQSQVLKVYTKAKGQDAQDMTNKFWSAIEPKADWTFSIGSERYRFKATLDTMIAEQMLIAQSYRSTFPWIMFSTMVAVCCLVGYSFSSAFVAFKLVFTVILPILAEYGLLIGIYQYGWLEIFGINTVAGIPWALFYMTSSVLFALALDYDVFLLARVYERRLEGYDNRSAVRIALEETGPTITLAGSLMMVAFVFVFISSVPMVSEVGCLYLVGVAVDTFVVRMWIAPAFLCMFEHLNYWPGKVPPAVKNYEDYTKMTERQRPTHEQQSRAPSFESRARGSQDPEPVDLGN